MAFMARRVLLPLVLLILLGCDEKEPPVSVPVDLPEPPELTAQPEPTAEPTATATATAQGKGWAGRPGGASTATAKAASITGCCSALLDKANRSKDPATKKLYDQAAAICYRRSKLVDQGKMSRAEALTQVRSSLLGAAPAACR